MSVIIGITQNLALLLALTYLHGSVYSRFGHLNPTQRQLLKGLMFGLFAAIGITAPITVAPGVLLDSRSIAIIIAALYGGPIPMAITTGIVVAARLIVGGEGTLAGVGSALTMALISLALYYYLKWRGRTKPKTITLLLLGFLATISTPSWIGLLPFVNTDLDMPLLITTSIFYPLGTLLLGRLLDDQSRALATEQALRDSERRFRVIFNSSYQYIGLLKPDGRMIEVNQSGLETANLDSASVTGQFIWDMLPTMPASAREKITELVLRAAQGEMIHYEADNWLGDERAFDFSMRPVFDESGEVMLVVAEAHDITKHRQLEKQKFELAVERERASWMKELLSDLSHDLRTPLSVIRLNLDMLKLTTDPQRQQQRIDRLVEEEQRLTRLVSDMGEMVRLDDGKKHFKFARHDLNGSVNRVIEANRAASDTRGQTLTLTLAEQPLYAEIDPANYERAINILLVNAIAYTPAGGAIRVSVRAEGERGVVEVRDTGIGIAAKDFPYIFERFYRADEARSVDTGGTGLGLAIARHIIEAHGGTIEAESTLGEGSSFRAYVSLSRSSPSD